MLIKILTIENFDNLF